MLVPKALGGEEMDWLEYLEVIRTIAQADGSTGWCVNQAAVFATTSARISRELATEVWGNPRTVVGNGPPQFVESVPVDGGYRLSGRWMFSSGCRHANWIAALIEDKDSIRRLHMLPRDQVDFVDLWQVHGLRGTGSFCFETHDTFVPASRTAVMEVDAPEGGPLYVIPFHLLFACGFACVALGVSRAGLDATIALVRAKTAQYGDKALCHDPVVQQQIGKAEAIWRAAKALLSETTTSVWRQVCESGTISVEERISLRMAGTHAIRQAADAIDIAYNLSGSDAVFASKPIQRRFQDAHAITQQIQGRESHYQTAGQLFLGLEPKGGIF